MKKILGAVGVLAGLAFALPPSIAFDIIIRDFQPTHPDFENFDDRAAEISASPALNSGYAPFASTCFGKNHPTDNPRYWACEDGYPCNSQKPNGQTAVQTRYGEYMIGGQKILTHRHIAMQLAGVTTLNKCGAQPCYNWEDPVFVTRDMVDSNLVKVNPTDPYTWIPVKKNDFCHNSRFNEDWWKDDPTGTITKRVETVMTLKRADSTSNRYYIDSKEMPNQAYFPLDSFATTPGATFGMQSLKLWCPPYGVLPASAPNKCAPFPDWECVGGWGEAGNGPAGAGPATLSNVCQSVLANGGPKNTNAIIAAVTQYPEAVSMLHNYLYTIVGYTKFTYNPKDTFLFSGDDDMWIFIDGKLVADLGGTHLPAEARIAMDDWAALWGWTAKSKHDLHFFYVDRQTDGSNLRITTTIAELSETTFGAPRIMRAERTSGDTTAIFLNNKLSDASIAAIASSSANGIWPVIGIKKRVDPATGGIRSDTMALFVTGFKYVDQDTSGKYIYAVSGKFCLDAACSDSLPASSGDSLAFNYYAGSGHKFEPPQTFSITNQKGSKVSAFSWGVVTTSSFTSTPIAFKPSDNTVERPPLNLAGLFTGNSSFQLPPGGVYVPSSAADGPSTYNPNGGAVNVQPIGAAGNNISSQSMGEVSLALYPAEGLSASTISDLTKKGFGLPQEVPAGQLSTGIQAVDPYRTVPPVDGVSGFYQAVSGPTSGQYLISHCESRASASGDLNNTCLGISFDVSREFQVNVQVYDHLGNFVSRYSKKVSKVLIDSLRAKQPAGPGVTPCVIDDKSVGAVKAGLVRATVNIYPISQTGRKLGSGVYILKVDVIQSEDKYCVASGTSGATEDKPFERAFSQIKTAFMRTNK